MDFLTTLTRFSKSVFVILIFPFFVSFLYHFPSHLMSYPGDNLHGCLFGILTFTLLYLFIYPCWEIYQWGQTVLEELFSFNGTFQDFMSAMFSFYTFILVPIFFLVTRVFDIHQYDSIFMFCLGFVMMMKFVLQAEDLQSKEQGKIWKISYWFSFIWMVFLNISILILVFDVVLDQFTYHNFFHKVLTSGRNFFLQFI